MWFITLQVKKLFTKSIVIMTSNRYVFDTILFTKTFANFELKDFLI